MIETPVNARQVTLPESFTAIAWPVRVSNIARYDLARFEGEGGPEALIPDLGDVPLHGALWRKLRLSGLSRKSNKITV
jgi:hypothetical protein